jgi:hypothetical protein
MITFPTKGAKKKRSWREWLEDQKTLVEIIGVIVLILTLIFTAVTAWATKDAVEASIMQLDESRYESVYQHNLDLWQLGAQDKDLAPYLVGGERPKLDEDGYPEPAHLHAAINQALDFYAYVFEQRAPSDTNNSRPRDILTTKPNHAGFANDTDWEDWASWAGTIRDGFDGAPGICPELKATKDAFDPEFYRAVTEAVREMARQQDATEAVVYCATFFN